MQTKEEIGQAKKRNKCYRIGSYCSRAEGKKQTGNPSENQTSIFQTQSGGMVDSWNAFEASDAGHLVSFVYNDCIAGNAL